MLYSFRVVEHSVLKRFLPLEYAIVRLVIFIGCLVFVLLYVLTSQVVDVFCSIVDLYIFLIVFLEISLGW